MAYEFAKNETITLDEETTNGLLYGWEDSIEENN
jgi:hypothetical protein